MPRDVTISHTKSPGGRVRQQGDALGDVALEGCEVVGVGAPLHDEPAVDAGDGPRLRRQRIELDVAGIQVDRVARRDPRPKGDGSELAPLLGER